MLTGDIGRPARVVSIGRSEEFHERVRAMLGRDAELVPLAPADPVPDCELAIVEWSGAAEAVLAVVARIQSSAPAAAVLVLAPGVRIPRQLILGAASEDLGRMTYRQVRELVGSILVPRYLEALLARHEGNVTKAALAARLERETLHRLIRRHALKASDYRRSRDRLVSDIERVPRHRTRTP